MRHPKHRSICPSSPPDDPNQPLLFGSVERIAPIKSVHANVMPEGVRGVATTTEPTAEAVSNDASIGSPNHFATDDGKATPDPSKTPRRSRLRDRVCALLTTRRIPFVDVAEARRALFCAAKLRPFHFVAYQKDGPNWLICAGTVTAEVRRDMAEWEKVFGDGFMAVLASCSQRESVAVQFRTLDGKTVYLAGMEPSNEPPIHQVTDPA